MGIDFGRLDDDDDPIPRPAMNFFRKSRDDARASGAPPRAGSHRPPDEPPAAGNRSTSTTSSGSAGASNRGGATGGAARGQQQDASNKSAMLRAMLERARYFANSSLAVQRIVFGKEVSSLCYQMLSCESAYQHLIQP